MVTYLYEVLSDVNGLVEMMPASGDVTGTERQFQDGHGNVGDEHEIREIRSLVSRTAQRLSTFHLLTMLLQYFAGAQWW